MATDLVLERERSSVLYFDKGMSGFNEAVHNSDLPSFLPHQTCIHVRSRSRRFIVSCRIGIQGLLSDSIVGNSSTIRKRSESPIRFPV